MISFIISIAHNRPCNPVPHGLVVSGLTLGGLTVNGNMSPEHSI